MLLNKLMIVGMLLMSVGTVMAWTDETAPLDNETLNVGFNPALNSSSVDDPYLYGLDEEVMSAPFQMPYYSSLEPITVCTSYTIYKQVWDGSSYTQINDCNISVDNCVDLYFNPTTEMYELPSNWAQVTSNGFMVKKYFQELINSDSQYCSQWNSSDSEFPDVFYTTVEVDVESGTTYQAYMYTKLDDDDIETLSSGDIDYGFALDGRGSGGGSGSIYEGINMYGSGAGDTTEMGASFNLIFWCIIPLIFILAVMKLSSRVMK